MKGVNNVRNSKAVRSQSPPLLLKANARKIKGEFYCRPTLPKLSHFEDISHRE